MKHRWSKGCRRFLESWLIGAFGDYLENLGWSWGFIIGLLRAKCEELRISANFNNNSELDSLDNEMTQIFKRVNDRKWLKFNTQKLIGWVFLILEKTT